MDLNIGTIDILTRKSDPQGLHFRNGGKKTDGFVLFTEGESTFFRKDSEPIPVKKGDLILLREGDEYSFSGTAPCAYVTAAFSFLPGSEEALRTLPVLLSPSEEVQKKILEAETVWRHQRWDRTVTTRILLLEIYRELFRRTRSSAAPAERAVARAKDYLHLHFRENFSTAEVAGHCGVSPAYLRALFLRETGMSITEFRDLLRIRAAKEMLSSDLFTIRETAEALGYCDVYYFSRSFRKATGISPARFRKGERGV